VSDLIPPLKDRDPVPYRSLGTLCLEASHPPSKHHLKAQNNPSQFCPGRLSQPRTDEASSSSREQKAGEAGIDSGRGRRARAELCQSCRRRFRKFAGVLGRSPVGRTSTERRPAAARTAPSPTSGYSLRPKSHGHFGALLCHLRDPLFPLSNRHFGRH
jgi:hypothetical protein